MILLMELRQKKAKIENYAKKLNFEINHINNDKNEVIDFVDSGYVSVLANKNMSFHMLGDIKVFI